MKSVLVFVVLVALVAAQYPTVTQKVCKNAKCTTECKGGSFPTNQCLKTNSATVFVMINCTSDGSSINEYPFSDSACSTSSGPSQAVPTNKCNHAGFAEYFEFICNSNFTVSYEQAYVQAPASIVDEYLTSWNAWKVAFNRTYTSDIEANLRFEIYKDNMDKVTRHNADKTNTWTMALNQFADMTQHEFASKMLGYKGRSSDYVSPAVHEYKGEELAASVNWITKGAVTNVKDQGQCGSCWAFSTCAALEGAVAVAGKPLISFAPQELVDCDKVDSGCNGGLMDNGFNYIKANGICNWNDYKYTARDGTCKKSQCTAAGHLTGYTDIGHTDSAMMSANNQLPIAVAVNAEPWQFYSGGIFSSACSQQLDHGVLAAGYTTDGSAYWLVKNSWGSSWGESGYIRLAKGNNLCGINNAASYPTGVSA